MSNTVNILKISDDNNTLKYSTDCNELFLHFKGDPKTLNEVFKKTMLDCIQTFCTKIDRQIPSLTGEEEKETEIHSSMGKDPSQKCTLKIKPQNFKYKIHISCTDEVKTYFWKLLCAPKITAWRNCFNF